MSTRVERGVRIPADDGVLLAADVTFPTGAGPHPALVILLPYRREDLAGAAYAAPIRYFAAHGYATVLADFRGLGGSDGSARAPFDPREADDGAAIVRWAAGQAWCDGAVGMWGMSYPAITALKTAAAAPGPLKAIAPIMANLDPYEDFVYPGGAANLMGALGSWGVSTLAELLLPPGDDTTADERARWRGRLDGATPYLLALHEHAEKDGFWQERVVNPQAITIPTFCIGGWRDLFSDGTIRTFTGLAGPRKLLMGPWMHTLPDRSPFQPVDYLWAVRRWFDHWLRGADTGLLSEPPVTLYALGRDAWLHAGDWPEGGSAMRAFHPTPGGALSEARCAAPALVEYETDPTVGVAAGLWGAPTSGIGLPLDQREDEARSLCFTSTPLDDAVLVIGAPEAVLHLDFDGGDELSVVVKLADIGPNGASTLITTGARTICRRPTAGEAMPVRLWSTCYEVLAGHRLRVVIAGADFPRLRPTPTNPTMRLSLGGERPSTVCVPVATDAWLQGPDPRPPEPSVHGDPPPVDALPSWTIERDLIDDVLTVTSGEVAVVPARDGADRMTVEQTVRATVARAHPDGAIVTGHCEITSHRSGRGVRVEARTTVHRGGIDLHGSVSVDGVLWFERRWCR